MFCQIKSFSSCKDIEKVQKTLFLSDRYGADWLNECSVSLSPCGSVVVLSRASRVCILSSEWDSMANCNVFANTWTGTLPTDVKSLLTFPVSQQSQIYPDWICVAVGLKSGEVRFFTDHGDLLLSEKFHDSPVLNIKCNTGLHSDSDELYIIYGEAVCCLGSTKLIQTLRFVRAQLTKGQGVVSKEAAGEGLSVLTRKLGFVGQDVVCDASVVGLEHSNTFDHLLTASTHGGFFTAYRSVAPHKTAVVGVGARPYLAFHQALEGGAQPLLHDVARSVASKIKSSIFGWLGDSGGKKDSNSQPVYTPPEPMLSCYAVCDLHRRGLHTTASPDRRLLAVRDSLGRVVLVDTKRATAIRIFKGYHEGQCGFLEVHEESQKRHRSAGRRTLFIILYLGKRGQIEVWPLRGPRITTFSAAQNAHLLYTQYPSPKPRGFSAPSLCFLYPDGQIKYLVVPFHFSLTNENSDRARDVHLLKRLRQLLKDKVTDADQIKNEVIDTLKEFKTIDIKIHCVEMMAASKNVTPDMLLGCLELLTPKDIINEAQISAERTKLSVLCENINALIRFLMLLNDIDFGDETIEDGIEDSVEIQGTDEENKEECDSEIVNDDQSATTPEEETLKEDQQEMSTDDTNVTSSVVDNNLITDSEMSNLQHLLNLATSTQHKRGNHQKVTFVENKKSVHAEFLACFDILDSSSALKLKDTLSDDTMLFLSQQIYMPYVVGKSDWKTMWDKCRDGKTMRPLDLCKLLFVYWMELSAQDITHLILEKFGKMLTEICQIEGFDKVYVGYSDTSPWWQFVRDFLVDARCPFKSMVGAQICRAVAKKIEREEEIKANGIDDDLWESVSRDNAQWGLLVGKLDDISLLSIVLSQKLSVASELPKLQIDLPEINLKYIDNNGKGSISELVSKWLCIAGVDPKDILENESKDILESKSKNDPKSTEKETEGIFSLKIDDDKSRMKVMSVFDKLTLLQRQFPFSLRSQNLIVNMCWEYANSWADKKEDLSLLKGALRCLKSIESAVMRCGICTMIWCTHLINSFMSAFKLIGKVGKLPKEKLCQQDVGLTDSQLLLYLEITTDFFDTFLCSALATREKEITPIRFEPIWEGNSTKMALTEHALNNFTVNIDILHVHYQMCASLYYQCYLGASFLSHRSYLFDVDSQRCMFGPLRNDATGIFRQHSTDSRVAVQRRKFLSRLVHKCTELAKDQGVWMDRILDLARIWRVDGDYVRREYVSRLFAQGFDSMARDAINSITDLMPLLKVLVPMAGRRMKHFIEGIDDRAEILSILPPTTTIYLQSLADVDSEITSVTSLESTETLLREMLWRGEQGADSQLLIIANALLDACSALKEHLGINA